VRRAFASSLLSLLLLTTMVWGGCISCEQYFMLQGAKSCCSKDGRCKTKTAPSKSSTRECKQLAFDDRKSVDLHIDLTAIALAKIESPLFIPEVSEFWRVGHPIEPSPPDLQILHSTFLI
jgi:hypothetical protein